MRKQVLATGQALGTRCGSYFWWKNRYLQPVRSLVHVHARLNILGRKTGTCDRPGLRYMPDFIFWVGKQVPATGQVSGTCTCRASYFGLENRYLRPARHQVHVRLIFLLHKLTGTDHRYTPRFIFWVGKEVPVAGTRRASCFGWVKRYLEPARSQIHLGLQVLGGKTGICDRPGPRYTSRFMFWVGKKVPGTGQVPDTSCASGFGLGKRYL